MKLIYCADKDKGYFSREKAFLAKGKLISIKGIFVTP
jgi:hypothetical protein